jgi:hypothetical protein
MYFDTQAFSGFSTLRAAHPGGYMPLYYSDTVNHCPGCGRTHWHVGRQSAECAFCDTALPLAATYSQPMEPLFWVRGSATAEAA